MSQKFKEETRNTIQETVRDEISKFLHQNTNGTPINLPSTTAIPSPSTSVPSTSEDTGAGQSRIVRDGETSTLSFKEFYRIREASRQEDFKPEKKKKRFYGQSLGGSDRQPTAVMQPKDVEIKVGLAYVSDGVSKARRNKTHVIKVSPEIEREELIEKAILKHGTFDQSFDRVSPYVILYPDYSEVYFVPGTQEEFTLRKYKEEISKDFKKLTFYSCLRDEFQENQISDWSSNDEENLLVKPQGCEPSTTVRPKSPTDYSNQLDRGSNATKQLEVTISERESPVLVNDNDDDDDPLLLIAINESQQETHLAINDEMKKDNSTQASSLDQALEILMKKIPDDQYTRIEVTRKHMVERTFEQLIGEDIKGRVIVKFIGEEGVDTGGVTREFFTNFFQSILNNGNLVRGSFPNLTLRHNVHALEDGKFEILGKLTAIALLNGCPGPHLFCTSLASYILDIPKEVDLQEVPEESECKSKLVAIKGCSGEQELSVKLGDFLERFEMVYTKPVITLNDKDDLIKACAKHIVISSVAEEIFSFCKGLRAFGVLQELCKFKKAGSAELVHCDVQTNEVKECFKPCFSLVGTDEHSKETEIVYHGQQFLKKAKNGKLKGNVLACPDWNNLDEALAVHDSLKLKVLSVNDVLQFGSGSRYPNFKGHLKFDHDCADAHKRISGNTCSFTITIPVNKRYTECNSDMFAMNIMHDIFEDYGIGQR